jgi:hypothetical protein
MTNEPCTPQDRQRIIAAAEKRANFLAWLAGKLLATDDRYIRKEAALAILQLIGRAE